MTATATSPSPAQARTLSLDEIGLLQHAEQEIQRVQELIDKHLRAPIKAREPLSPMHIDLLAATCMASSAQQDVLRVLHPSRDDQPEPSFVSEPT